MNTERKNLPIGIFDSGVGGLSVLRTALRLLPGERFIYYGDIANAPYGTKSEEEVRAWLAKQRRRYAEDGFGLWAMVLRQTGAMIGQCGLTWQDRGDGTQCVEVGYLLQRAFWHQGYATEAATACKAYAFQALGLDEVCSIIRDNNLASQAVARRNGMTVTGRLVKHYYGMDMPHLVFSVRRDG